MVGLAGVGATAICSCSSYPQPISSALPCVKVQLGKWMRSLLGTLPASASLLVVTRHLLPPSSRLQLGECVRSLVYTDYPEQWPGLLPQVVAYLTSQVSGWGSSGWQVGAPPTRRPPLLVLHIRPSERPAPIHNCDCKARRKPMRCVILATCCQTIPACPLPRCRTRRASAARCTCCASWPASTSSGMRTSAGRWMAWSTPPSPLCCKSSRCVGGPCAAGALLLFCIGWLAGWLGGWVITHGWCAGGRVDAAPRPPPSLPMQCARGIACTNAAGAANRHGSCASILPSPLPFNPICCCSCPAADAAGHGLVQPRAGGAAQAGVQDLLVSSGAPAASLAQPSLA